MSVKRPSKPFRGSKRRVRKIRMQGNWSLGLWVLVMVVLLALFVGVPWLMRHPPPAESPHATQRRQ